MTLKRPATNFLISQNLPQFGIQSPTALKAGDADNPDPAKSPYAQGQGGTGKSMVGTGPFMFKEWVPNDHVTIVKNPDYWDTANAAHLDSITFKPFADQTAELNALQAGDIDFAQTIAPNDVATLTARPELRGHRPRRVLQRVPPRPAERDPAVRQPQDPPGDRVRAQQAVVHRRLLRGPGQRRRQLHAAGDPVLQAPRPADLRPREGEGPDRRVRRVRRPARDRLLLPVRRRPAVHARSEGRGRGDRHGPRGRRLQDQPQDRGRGAPATSATLRPASSPCSCSAGPATGPARTTS